MCKASSCGAQETAHATDLCSVLAERGTKRFARARHAEQVTLAACRLSDPSRVQAEDANSLPLKKKNHALIANQRTLTQHDVRPEKNRKKSVTQIPRSISQRGIYRRSHRRPAAGSTKWKQEASHSFHLAAGAWLNKKQ